MDEIDSAIYLKLEILHCLAKIALDRLAGIIKDKISFQIVQQACYLTYRAFFLSTSDKTIHLSDDIQQISFKLPFGLDIDHIEECELCAGSV